jgi:hypothetical protein
MDVTGQGQSGASGAAEGGASSGAAEGAAAAGGAAEGAAAGGKEGAGAAAAKAAGDAGTPGDAQAAAAAAAYKANLKYKVLKEEKDFPEWARPFVTSADLEKQFRDTFERADGLASVKEHRDVLVSENEAMREQWLPVVQATQTAMGHLKKGDLDSFFESVGITEANVLRYALHRLQLRENPAALQQHEQQRQLQLQNQQLQEQLQQAQSGYQNVAVQTREFQLETHLQRPENLSAVQAFDARVGKPGAFRAEVIRRGQAYAMQGIDAPVEQCVGEILQIIGWQGQTPQVPAAGQNGQGAAAGAGASENAQIPQSQKPVLPHLKGKSASPVKKAPKSTAELRELGRQLRG